MKHISYILLLFFTLNCQDSNDLSDVSNEIELLKEEIKNLKLNINQILDGQTENSERIDSNDSSILELISRINDLEVSEAKYDSEIVGCHYLGDWGFQILNNGVGIYDTGSNTGFQLFTWEKTSPNTIQFNFMGYNDDDNYTFVYPGTYSFNWNNFDDELIFPIIVYDSFVGSFVTVDRFVNYNVAEIVGSTPCFYRF
jgi:hypothetical protein